MARMIEMVEDFKQFPPVFEIARTQVLMPGDEGYKKPPISKQRAEQAARAMVGQAGKEPEWMRQRRLKMERQLKSKGDAPHGR